MDGNNKKGTLPDGWIVKISKKFPDRVYYFNVHTGSSTWECPNLHPSENNKNKQIKGLSVLDKQASNKHDAVHPEAKPTDYSKEISEFLSDAKRKSPKQQPTKNKILSGHSLHSKSTTPPTAVVAPVVIEKKLTSLVFTKKKPSKKKSLAASLVALRRAADSSSKTMLEKKDFNDTSKKVCFTVKSQKKIPISKSESAVLSLSKNSTPKFKKKGSIVISVPTSTKCGSSIGHEMRNVTFDKNNILPLSISSDLRSKIKESLNSGVSLRKQTLPPQSKKDKLNVLSGCKAVKQNKLTSQNKLNVNLKRIYDALITNSDGDFSTSKSKSVIESEIVDMDCEMNSDCEELTITTSSTGVNIGASTSNASDKDSFDDIEMLDMSSSDLVKIDDMFGFSFQNSLLERYFLVVDTNVFISELKYIGELKDNPVNGCGPPHFIIPWVVLQELDNLKRQGGRSKDYDLIKSAGEAIRYLNSLLKAKHPRFHFQHPDEAKICKKDFSRNNDDQLLECCLKLQERMPKEKVILLTNDKNLSNKAMVCNVVVHDRKSLTTVLKPDLEIKESPPINQPNPVYVPDPFRVLSELKSLEQKYQQNHQICELEIENHLTKAKQVLKSVLDPLFKKEMDDAYGDAWHFFEIERDTLNGILNGIMRYWRTVFVFFFSFEEKAKFELLQKKSTCPKGFLGEREECLSILSTIEDLFTVIKKKWPDIHVPFAEIRNLKSSTELSFSNLSECEKNFINFENKIKQTEMSCCVEIFNHNWTVINHLSGCALDFCNIPHDLVYDKSVPFPPKSEFLRIIPKLKSWTSRLKDIMERMLLVVKSSITSGSVFKELRMILKELVPSLNIQVENICNLHFSAKILETFCRSTENRVRVEDGFKQLVNFDEKLGNALHALLNMA